MPWPWSARGKDDVGRGAVRTADGVVVTGMSREASPAAAVALTDYYYTFFHLPALVMLTAYEAWPAIVPFDMSAA